MFGSNDYDSQQKSVRCSFITCGSGCSDSSTNLGTCAIHKRMKGAVRISRANRFKVHTHQIQSGFHTHKESSRVNLNHYPI